MICKIYYITPLRLLVKEGEVTKRQQWWTTSSTNHSRDLIKAFQTYKTLYTSDFRDESIHYQSVNNLSLKELESLGHLEGQKRLHEHTYHPVWKSWVSPSNVDWDGIGSEEQTPETTRTSRDTYVHWKI